MEDLSKFNRGVFKCSFYNKNARLGVSGSAKHRFLENNWGDTHSHDIIASDEKQARDVICLRFPPEDGFVIEKIDKISG